MFDKNLHLRIIADNLRAMIDVYLKLHELLQEFSTDSALRRERATLIVDLQEAGRTIDQLKLELSAADAAPEKGK